MHASLLYPEENRALKFLNLSTSVPDSRADMIVDSIHATRLERRLQEQL